MTIIANLGVRVTAGVGGFVRNMGRAGKSVKGFSTTAVRAASKAAALGVALTALATGGGIVAATKASFSLIDAQAKVADKLGETTEAMAGLNLAGRLTGVSTEKLNMGLQRATRRIAEAAQGSGEAQGALKELGLDARRLAQLSPARQFREISVAMQGVAGQSDRIRLGFKLFDSEGVDLIRTLKLGTQGLADAQAMAVRFGTAISRTDAARIEHANDQFGLLKERVRGVFNQVAIRLAPAVAGLATALINWGGEGASAAAIVEKAFTVLRVRVLGPFARTIDGLQAAWFGFKGAVESVASGVLRAVGEVSNTVSRVLNAFTGSRIKGIGPSMLKVADAFGASAEKSFARAGANFNEAVTGASTSQIASLIDQWKANQDEVVAKVFDAGGATGAGGAASAATAATAAARAVFGQQVNLGQTSLSAFGRQQEQKIVSPQIDRTNELLTQIVNNMSGGVFV